MRGALAATEKDRLPKRRNLAVAAFLERTGGPKINLDADVGGHVKSGVVHVASPSTITDGWGILVPITCLSVCRGTGP